MAVIAKNSHYYPKVSSLIEGRLLENSIVSNTMGAIMMKDKVKIRIVSRNSIQEVLNEHNFSINGLTKKETSALGQLLNADVLIFPSKVDVSAKDSFYSDKKERCIVRRGYASLIITAVRVDNGEVLTSDTYEGEDFHKECADNGVETKVPLTKKVEANASYDAVDKFVTDLKNDL